MPANYPPSFNADWTVTITSDLAGSGTVTTIVLDATTNEPAQNQNGTVTGRVSFAVGRPGTATLQQFWNYLSVCTLPAKLAFLITVKFSDEHANAITQTLTVPEAPRNFTPFSC